MLAVAGIAAYVSYWHAYAVVRAHGESGITARLEPATIDGLVYASSMVVLYAARHRVPVPSLARWLLGLGIAATLTANMAQGWSHGPVGAVVAAWPAVSLAGSYELLVWLIRISGTAGPGPSAEHPCDGAACRAVAGSAPDAAVDSGQYSRSQRGVPGQAASPRIGSPGGPAIPAGGQHDNAVAEASAVNDAAVAAYRLACRPATRCRNASSPSCSDAHPAAGREPGSPTPGKHRRSRTRRAPRSGLDRTPWRHLGQRPRRHNPPFYTGPVVSREHRPREVHQPCRLQRARQELSVASWYEPISGARRRLSAEIPSVAGVNSPHAVNHTVSGIRVRPGSMPASPRCAAIAELAFW